MILAITDYDPWGDQIAEKFFEKLGLDVMFGKDKVTLHKLIGSQPDLEKVFTRRQIQRYKRDLLLYSEGKQSLIGDWFEKTDGIDGEKYGVHIDLADRRKLRKLVDDWVHKLTRKKKK